MAFVHTLPLYRNNSASLSTNSTRLFTPRRLHRFRPNNFNNVIAKTIMASALAFSSPSFHSNNTSQNITSPPTLNLSSLDVTKIESEADFRALQTTEDVVVYKFFAKWCRSCKGIEQKVKKIARDYASENIAFAEIDIDGPESPTWKAIMKEANITNLPYFVVYKNGKKFDDFNCGWNQSALLRQRIDHALGAQSSP